MPIVNCIVKPVVTDLNKHYHIIIINNSGLIRSTTLRICFSNPIIEINKFAISLYLKLQANSLANSDGILKSAWQSK